MKRIITVILTSLILITFFVPISFADSWKVIVTDPKDSKMEADIKSISFKEDEQFFYIKFESHTNWNLYAQKGSLFMYFDIYGNIDVRRSTAVLIITEYEMNKYAVGFFDMMTEKITQCENDFKQFSEVGTVVIPREAILNKFFKFSFLCVLGHSYYGEFEAFDICPDGGSMRNYISKFCPKKPILQVTKSVIDFGSVRKNTLLRGEFQIFNCGTTPLNVWFDNPKEYIDINPSKITLDEFKFDTINIEVSIGGLEPNRYEDIITINSNGGTANLKITFEILKEPELYFEPKTIDFGIALIGEKAVQTVKIGNKNKGPINIKLSTDVDWIAISKSRFESESEEIKLTAITRKLSPGEYSGKLKIISDGGNDEIPLKIKVGYPLSLNKEMVDFGKVFSNNLVVESQTVVLRSNLDHPILVNAEIDSTWIKIKETEFEVLSNEEKEIEISVDLSQIENDYKVHTGKITFSLSDLDFKIDLTVQIEILEALPKIEISIEGNVKSIEGELIVGEKFEKKITIKNAGGGILKGKAYLVEKNSPIKLSTINFSLKSSAESNLIVYLDSSDLKPSIVNNTLILDSNSGKVEIPISIKINPKPPIIITLKIGSTEAHAGGKIVILDSPPYIKNGTTLVPIRFISEALGAKVEWLNIGKGRVFITFKDKEIILDIGSTTAFINKKPYTLLVAPEVVKGRTFVPIRFISEGLGAEVKWIAQTQEIIITLQQ